MNADSVDTSHEHGHSRPSYDDVNSVAIFMAVIISAILTVVIVAVVQGMAYHWQRQYETSASVANAPWSSNAKIEEQKKVVADAPVKLEAAMDSVIRQFGADGAKTSQGAAEGDSGGSAANNGGEAKAQEASDKQDH